jgi:hypothetical protein
VPINPNFSWNSFRNTGEQNLAENLMIEAIKMFGMDVYYIPQTHVNTDTVFGEDPLRMFSKYYTIEMYLDMPAGYEGDRTFISKAVGFQLAPMSSFVVAKRRFNEAIRIEGAYNTPNPNLTEQDVRPLEGDLIYVPLTKDLWEIKYAQHEEPFFQLGQVIVWRLMVEKWAYSSERLSTGNNAVDKIQTAFSHDLQIPPTDATADNAQLDSEESTTLDFSETDPFSEGNI